MGCRGWRRRISERPVDECIGNSNAILPMITVAGVPPFHSDAIEAELLIIWKYFHITSPTALGTMSI
jgi:hypothetical protein